MYFSCIIRAFCLLICIKATFAAFAKDAIHFEHLSVEQGLAQSTVSSIVQDKQGFLWFATDDGLNRYDGYHFKLFKNDPDDPGSLVNNSINRLFLDNQNRLWVATYAGLSRYEPDNNRFVNYTHDPKDPSSISHGLVMSVYQDHQGQIWIATLGGGLNRYDKQNDRFEHFVHDPDNPYSISDNNVYSMLQQTDGTFWVATRNGGLNRFDMDSKRFERFLYDPNVANSLSHNRVYTLIEDSHAQLWIGTRGGGLNRFDPQTHDFVHYRFDQNVKHSINSDHIFALAVDKDGVLWVGGRSGLSKYQPKNDNFINYVHRLEDQNSLSDNWVRSITFDQTGIMWVGTHGGGLNKFNPAIEAFGHTQSNYSVDGGLNDNSVWSFHQDQDGTLWVGTQMGGLNRLDPQGKSQYYLHDKFNPDSIAHNFVGPIVRDQQGVLWVGTRSGLNRFDPKTQRFSQFDITPHPFGTVVDTDLILALINSQDGKLWVGSRKGLHKFDQTSETFTSYYHDSQVANSLTANWIQSLYIDQKQRLWVGSRQGLNLMNEDGETFRRFVHQSTDKASLSDNSVNSILQDRKGRVWIGTKNGLNLYQPQQQNFIRYTEKQGLSNNTIYSIIEDKLGQLWISTNRGLNRFNVDTGIISHYYAADGLQSDEFRQGAFYQASDGRIFVGGIRGYNAFYPEDIIDDHIAPNIALTDFLLFNRSVPAQDYQPNVSVPKALNQAKQLVLDHSHQVFSFEFSALHYAHPINNGYQYQLQGFDQDWITTNANKRFATYTNIRPGDYVFRVRGSNQDGLWSLEEKQIKLTIKASIWRTNWAYFGYFVMFMGCLTYLTKQRLMAVRAREEALANKQMVQAEKMAALSYIVCGVAHEVNTPLGNCVTLISLQYDHLNALKSLFEQNKLKPSTLKKFINMSDERLFSAQKNIQRSVDLVSRFKQIAVDQNEDSLTDFNLYRLLQLIIDSYAGQLRSHHVEIRFVIAKDIVLHSYVDVWNKIINNLLENSVIHGFSSRQDLKKSFQGLPLICIEANIKQDSLWFRYSDNGQGMNAEQVQRVFDPFYTTNRAFGGIGLGMHIVYNQVVQRLHGSIKCQSQVGRGCSFTLQIPFHLPEDQDDSFSQ